MIKIRVARSLACSLALRSARLSAVDIVIKCRKVYCGDFAPPWRVWVADEFIVNACRVPFSSRRGFCRALAIPIDFSERGKSSISYRVRKVLTEEHIYLLKSLLGDM